MTAAPDTAATLKLEVQAESRAAGMPPEAEMQACLEATVRRAIRDDQAQLELVLRVVGEDEGRALNRRFAHRDKATNVLSFPAAAGANPDGPPQPLGDIVICAPVVEREAAQQGKEAGSHWLHLAVHGALHLLGYDHATADEAAAMEALEIEILAEQGIANPYRGQ